MNPIQKVKGTDDILSDSISKWHTLEEIIRYVAKVYNFHEWRTPIMEYTELFVRSVGESTDVVNKEMYTFDTKGGKSVTLRPEGTAGVLRAYVQHKMYASEIQPTKIYYIEPMFRYEQPQLGRQRQFNQFGVEVLGDKSPFLDIEVIQLGLMVCQLVGLENLRVLINTLGDEESRSSYKSALLEYFTPHITTMCLDCQRRLHQNPLRILDCKVDANHEAMLLVPDFSNFLTSESKEYFNNVLSGLDELGINYEISPKLVRGLDYYTHTIFEVISLNEASGSQSTLFGGGRYDGLVKQLGGPEVSGVGFGMGMERILIASEAEGKTLLQKPDLDVYIMPFNSTHFSQSLVLASIIRKLGFTCEVALNENSFKSKFKMADRYGSKFVAVIGDDEVNEKYATFKDLSTKEQFKVNIEDNALAEFLDTKIGE